MTVIPLPTPAYQYGKVVGRVVHAIADTASDVDQFPEGRPAQGKVTFKPRETLRVVTTPAADRAFVTHEPVEAMLDPNGRIIDAEGNDGIWLVTGTYDVSFQVTRVGAPKLPPLVIEVTTDHTNAVPLDLTQGVSYTPPSGVAVQTLQVPSGGTDGDVLVRSGAGFRLEDPETLVSTSFGTTFIKRTDITASASEFLSATNPIQAAVNELASLTNGNNTTSRGAKLLLPSRRIWETDAPIQLPRTGATPVSAVQLVGEGPRQSRIVGVTGGSLTSGRGIIEWVDTKSRAWHQQISGLSITLPNTAGVHAIRFKRNGSGTTLADFNDERLQIQLEDLLIEGNNDYHTALIRLDGQVFFSTFTRVIGDCTRGTTSLYDTTLLQFDEALPSGSVDSDICGLSYSDIEYCVGNMRRGGRHQLIKGRAKNVRIISGFTDGSETDPGIDLRNSFNVKVESHNNEGRSATQVRFRDSAAITIDRLLPSSQDPIYPDWQASTAYAVGAGVIIPGWRSNTDTAPTNNSWFKATTAGTSGASQPTWPSSPGATVVDGGVTWENMGPSVQDALVFENCADLVVNLVTTSTKPAFKARGVKAASFHTCTNVRLLGAVPGDPNDEIGWTNTTGFARLRGTRANVYRTIGTDPYAAAAVDLSPVFIPATALTPSEGTTPNIVVTRQATSSDMPGYAFDATVDEFTRYMFKSPAGWSTATVEILWLNGGSGSGSVVWRSRLGYIHQNMTISAGTSQDSTITASAVDIPIKSTISTGPVTITPNGIMLLEVGRRGSSGADTLANDAVLLGVYLHKAT